MVHRFECPLCGKPVTAEEDLLGTRVRCPHCEQEFTARDANGTAPDTSASPVSTAYVPTIRFTFTCQRCGSALEGHSGLCKQLGRCPTCGAVFTIPEIDRRTGLPLGPAVVADDGELPTPMHAYAAAGTKAPSIRRRSDGEPYILCPRCDFESSIEANICPRCGLPFTIEGASAVAVGAATASNSLATASLVFGILALPTYCFPLLGVVAIATGLIALHRMGKSAVPTSGRGQAIGGLVCGGLSIAFWVIQMVAK